MASTDRRHIHRASRARDRSLIHLRRARRLVVVTVAAGSLGFTVLAARAFPGHHATPHARPQAVASLNPPKWAHRPAPRHASRHHHHHVAGTAAAAPVAPATPATSPPPQPSAAPPVAAQPVPPPPPPAPVVPAPAPTPQPPVVSSGGS